MKKLKFGLIALALAMTMAFAVACGGGLGFDDLRTALNEEDNVTVSTVSEVIVLGTGLRSFTATRGTAIVTVTEYVGMGSTTSARALHDIGNAQEGLSSVRRGDVVIQGPTGEFFDFVVVL